jgi:hypothetical protein
MILMRDERVMGTVIIPVSGLVVGPCVVMDDHRVGMERLPIVLTAVTMAAQRRNRERYGFFISHQRCTGRAVSFAGLEVVDLERLESQHTD